MATRMVRRAALAHLGALIVEGDSIEGRARTIVARIARYAAGTWRHDAAALGCPYTDASQRAAMWRLLRAGGGVPLLDEVKRALLGAR